MRIMTYEVDFVNLTLDIRLENSWTSSEQPGLKQEIILNTVYS
jgi:hypothetical protein